MAFTQVNGHVIHYRWIDEQKDRTFVFLNSLGTDFRIWNNLVDDLRQGGNILLADKRGHGLSDLVPGTNSLEDYSDDTVALLNHLEIDNAVIVGLSIGGMIAMELTQRIPGKIEKLVLCDTRHRIGTAEEWNKRICLVQIVGLEGISEEMMEIWFSRDFRKAQEDAVRGFQNMLERTSTEGYIHACNAIRDADLTKIARQISVPTLCVAGDEDPATNVEDVQGLAELIDGGRFEVIENSAHLPCVDNPDSLIEVLRDFV